MLDKFAFTRGMVESHFPAIQFEFMQSHFGLDFGLVGKGNAAGMTIELFSKEKMGSVATTFRCYNHASRRRLTITAINEDHLKGVLRMILKESSWEF